MEIIMTILVCAYVAGIIGFSAYIYLTSLYASVFSRPAWTIKDKLNFVLFLAFWPIFVVIRLLQFALLRSAFRIVTAIK